MKDWQKGEKRDEKNTGGQRTRRSGGLWFDPGDISTHDFLIDTKTTKHKSFSISLKMWQKIRREALLHDRMPALSVKFTNITMPNGEPFAFVAIDEQDFYSWFQKGEEK